MTLFSLPEISILDGGGETCVVVKGWEVLSFCFYGNAAWTGGESILSEKITAVDLSVASYISLVIYKRIHNDASNHSLLSKFH
jgi:hypothetical protein